MADRAENQKMNPEKPFRPKVLPQAAGLPHMGQPGHHEALDPARALFHPRARVAVRFLIRRRLHHLGPPAASGDADAKITILGDVMGVPASQFLQRRAAEEQGRAAKGHHKAQPRDAGQQQPEPGGIFDGETARQPVLARVVIVEDALKADHIGAARVEMFHHPPDLVGLGRVLGVVDADKAAATMVERIVQRPRLGAHAARRHRDDAHPQGQLAAGKGGAGGGIVLLYRQDHVEKVRGIIERFQSLDQARCDVVLAIKRHDDRHHRQPRDGDRRQRRLGPAQRGPGGQPQPHEARHRRQSNQRDQRQQPDRPQHHQRHQRQRPERQMSQHPGWVVIPATQRLGHRGFGRLDQRRTTQAQHGGAQFVLQAESRDHRAEQRDQPRAVAPEPLGAGRGHHSHARDPAPRHDAFGKAGHRAKGVDQRRVGRAMRGA